MAVKHYKVKHVFIASAGDLVEERYTFFNTVMEVNRIKAHGDGFHLEPLGWEDTLPGKGRPQEIINQEVLKCDLFIGLFWKRWGSPTGKFSSGTEEELSLASKANEETGKPDIWLLFKDIPKVDYTKEEQAQIDKIFVLQQKIISDNLFLYKSFESQYEWEKKLRQYLCEWLNQIRGNIEGLIDTDEAQMCTEITYTDMIEGNSKNEIYFTIHDDASMQIWKCMSNEEKKQYLYHKLSRYLYLNIGANPYIGVMRYKQITNGFILLGTVSFVYGASIEGSKFYIPPDYNELFIQNEGEKSIVYLHSRYSLLKGKAHS